MGGDGKQARNHIQENKGVDLLNRSAGAATDPAVLDAMAKYSRGEMKLQDALKSVTRDNSGKIGELRNSIKDMQGRMAGTKRGGLNAGNAGLGAIATGGPIGALGGLFGPGSDDGGAGNMQNQINDWEKMIADLEGDQQANRTRQHQFYTDPSTGTLVATDQVKNNDLFKGIFGDGGLNDRLLTEEKDLAGRGFSLTGEDHEAYGQASAETARMFGQEEASLSQALAARGLAAAPSGAAGVGFSGLMGNKSERLAGAQRKIADDRMKMNQERLSATRNFAMEGNRLAQAAVGDQFGRNRQGVNDYNNTLKDTAHAGQILQGQENVGFEQVEATRGPTLGEAAMGVLGGAASAGIGAATGGIGTGIGSAIGGSLGSKLTKK